MTWRRTLVMVLLLMTACTKKTVSGPGTIPPTTGIPGDCIGVDVASSPEKVTLLNSVADTFNAKRTQVDGKCVFVRIQKVASGGGEQQLAAGWDEATNGPLPNIWSPAAGAWGGVLNVAREQNGQPDMTGDYKSLQLTPLVIAMPEPMARALGWPSADIGYGDIIALAKDPQGWASKGHPEWGAFKLGKTNPNFSTSGLNATIATYYAATGKVRGLSSDDVGSPQVKQYVAAVEQAVVHYGDTTLTFLDNLYSEDQKGRGLTYISAVTVEEKSVLDYNRGDPEGLRPPDQPGTPPRVKLVSIYPKEGTLYSDSPLFVLDAPWNDAAHKQAAQAFVDFATSDRSVQAQTLKFGFRPGSPDVPLGDPITTANGVDPAKPTTVLEVPKPATTARILQAWEETRKRARVLLVLDVSGSMSDPVTRNETKLDLAKRAIQETLPQFEGGDQVGFWIFTTGLPPNQNDYQELVPIGEATETVEAIQGRVGNLSPLNGTPLYTAIEASYKAVQDTYDPTRINAVVLLTDGRNEDDRNSDRAGLIQRLSTQSKESPKPVRVFTIGYGKDADLDTLKAISAATDSAAYDSSNPNAIIKVFQTVISNF